MRKKIKQKPIIDEINHLLQSIDDLKKQGHDPISEDIARLLKVFANGNVLIEDIELMDQALTAYDYGHITFTITHHVISARSASATTTPHYRRGNMTLQLPGLDSH